MKLKSIALTDSCARPFHEVDRIRFTFDKPPMSNGRYPKGTTFTYKCPCGGNITNLDRVFTCSPDNSPGTWWPPMFYFVYCSYYYGKHTF